MSLTADQRRALRLLANDPHGITEALMSAHGFRREMLAGLVYAGFAMITTGRMRAGAATDYRNRAQGARGRRVGRGAGPSKPPRTIAGRARWENTVSLGEGGRHLQAAASLDRRGAGAGK
jgi:hypothetical protein